MTYYPDLTPCSYFDRHLDRLPDDVAVFYEPWASHLLSVGWLADTVPSRVEDPAVVERVVDLFVRLYCADGLVLPFPVTFGSHGCEICSQPDNTITSLTYKGVDLTLGSGYFAVPGESVLYVSPTLVIHYMLAHSYVPPREFCDAALRCPDPASRAYARAVLRNGPPWLKWDIPAGEMGSSWWRSLVNTFLEQPWVSSSASGRWLIRSLRKL